MIEQVLIGIIFFLTSLIYTIFGFGYSMLAIPLLSMIISPKLAISLTIFLGLYLSSWLVYTTFKDVRFKKIINLVIGCVLGVPLGTWVLSIVEPNVIKIYVNVIIILTVFFVIFKKNTKKCFSNEGLMRLIVGFLSGFLGSSTGISGPPVIMFGLRHDRNNKEFRANLIMYFAIWAIFANVNYFLTGVVEIFSFIRLLIPGLIGSSIGVFFGKKAFLQLKLGLFSNVCWILIVIISFFGIVEVLVDHF
jgi:uncharacterized membrane protein YfcA